MMNDQTLISGAPRVKLKWYQVIDPITKLLFILDMTLLSFTSMNLLLQAGLILVATLLLLFSKLSSTIFKALGGSDSPVEIIKTSQLERNRPRHRLIQGLNHQWN